MTDYLGLFLAFIVLLTIFIMIFINYHSCKKDDKSLVYDNDSLIVLKEDSFCFKDYIENGEKVIFTGFYGAKTIHWFLNNEDVVFEIKYRIEEARFKVCYICENNEVISLKPGLYSVLELSANGRIKIVGDQAEGFFAFSILYDV